MTYFQDSELQCKCGKCSAKLVDFALLSCLNELRERYGKPIFISSGIRCPEYNKKVGGVKDSAHLMGQAVDIFCTSSHDRYLLLFHAIKLFHRIGIDKTFLHLDVDLDKPYEVIWLYGNH